MHKKLLISFINFISCFFMFFIINIYAADQKYFNLLAIYQLAKQVDPEYLAAVKNYQASLYALPKAVSTVLPSINLASAPIIGVIYPFNSYNYLRTDSNQQKTSSKIRSYGGKINQDIFNVPLWLKVSEAYNNNLYIIKFKLLLAEQDLIMRVATAYFEVNKAKILLKVIHSQKKLVKKNLEEVKERAKVGLATRIDLLNTEADYQNLLSQEIVNNNLLINKKNLLRKIIGLDKTINLAALNNTSNYKFNDNITLEQWEFITQQYSPNLYNNKILLRNASLDYDAAIAKYLPVANVEAAKANIKTKLNNNNVTSNRINFYNINGQLNLFAGGGDHASVKQAYFNYLAQKFTYSNQLRSVLITVRSKYNDINSTSKQIQANKLAYQASNAQYHATLEAFKLGSRDMVELLESIHNVNQQYGNLELTKYNFLINILALKQSVGVLNEHDLRLINDFFK